MITVAIMINGKPIHARSAVNVGQAKAPGVWRYEVDDGSELEHHRDDGAIELAIAMLRTIKERGATRQPEPRDG